MPRVKKATKVQPDPEPEIPCEVEEAPAPKRKAATKRATKSAPKKAASPPSGRQFRILVDQITSNSEVDREKLDSLQNVVLTGKNPQQAGKKAFTKICRAVDTGDADPQFYFYIQEIKEGDTGKKFSYEGVRTKLSEPKVVKKGESSFNIQYSSSVKSWKPEGTATKKPAKTVTKKSEPVEEPEDESEDESEEDTQDSEDESEEESPPPKPAPSKRGGKAKTSTNSAPKRTAAKSTARGGRGGRGRGKK